MKLRIKGDSLRVRLSRSEVDSLAQSGTLEDSTRFVSSTLKYTLTSKEGISDLEADFNLGEITLYVPSAIATAWPGNDVISYKAEMPLPGGNKLALLLEKDFKCIDNTEEDQSDNYENPNAAC